MVVAALKNRQFLLLLIIFSCLDGVFDGFGVVLNPLLGSLGFTAT